jgi:membrane protease YdiL (CAAX protease family)
LTRKLVAWLTLVGVVAAIDYTTAVNEFVLFAVILALVLWIARGLETRDAFGLRAPASWGRAIAIACGVFIAIAVCSRVLNPLLHPGREQGLTPSGWNSARAGAFAVNLVALAVVGPIVEELTFRGLGFTLLERYGNAVAIVGVGVAFALWHGLVEAFPVLFVFGAALAYLRSRTGSVYPGMILHGLFNALALTIAVTV